MKGEGIPGIGIAQAGIDAGFTQAGSGCRVIAVAIESLLELGLSTSDRHRPGGIFKGLLEEAGLDGKICKTSSTKQPGKCN